MPKVAALLAPVVVAPPVPVQIAIYPKKSPATGYVIEFYPNPQDPQPVIYFTEKGRTARLDLPRLVQWTLVTTLPASHYVKIIPKAYNSQIFHPAGTTPGQEKLRLDNNTPIVTSNRARRGPKLNLGLAWYYGVHLFKVGAPKSLVSFPPRVVDKSEGQEIAYLDPVVIIKDEP